MPNHDSEVFHLAQGPFPTATAGRRLPCWCRGRERAPLKSLPIFQFLEAQYEANGLGALITPASATRGLGRGKPLGHTAHVGGSSSSSDTDDDINVVESFNRRRRPLTLPALSQNPDSTSCTTRAAPRARLLDPKPKEAKLSENPQNIKRCIESGWKTASSGELRGPTPGTGARTPRVPRRTTARSSATKSARRRRRSAPLPRSCTTQWSLTPPKARCRPSRKAWRGRRCRRAARRLGASGWPSSRSPQLRNASARSSRRSRKRARLRRLPALEGISNLLYFS
ncbi:hypothetical protein ISCGN_002810 [Ixodes scapularis]